MDFKINPSSEFKEISIEQTYEFLSANENGLTDEDVKQRITFFGPNAITEKKKNPFVEFFSRYWGPMPWLLELAMVLSIILKHDLEGIIIFVLLTVNAIIGFMHSRGSQKAVELLKQRLAIKAKVLRNGEWVTDDSSQVVPGDVMIIKMGDIVPADAKIISGDIAIDESALTGESLPIDKQPLDIVYSGAVVRRGEARCIVINTGQNTYFGKTAELVKIAKPKSHQEEIMMAIVKYMMYLGIAASIIVGGYAFIHNEHFLVIMTFVVVFLMGAVPVALPAVMTIVQAATGVQLAKSNVLVTRLDSIEDAASISVLCLDKTGTITENKLSVTDSIPFSGYSKEDSTQLAALASRAEGMDLIDVAIIDYAKASKVDTNSHQQVSYTPFNPAIRRTEAIIQHNGSQFKVVKGASQVILPMCSGVTEELKAKVDETIADFSRKGYRTIAVARSKDNDFDTLDFVGLLPLSDPPRADSAKMIAEMKSLGVKPIMLTGDNMAIAQEIAKNVGIGENIIRLADIEKLSHEDQAKKVASSDGFAEIYPEDKYRIVKLLQENGYMVGMTGDGVNDAPALKQAEMGIAVSNATDVAKASASVVLLEPGVRVIVEAIERSRETYQRMLTWVINKVTKVIQVVGLLTVGFFMVHHQMVLSMLGMALLVFANDFVTMSLATDNVQHTANPNAWDVLNITYASLLIGILLVVEGIAAVIWGQTYFGLGHHGLKHLQTWIMLMLVFTSQFRVMIVRERKFFWSSIPGNALILSTVGALIGFVLLGIYGVIITPIPANEVFSILLFSLIFTFAIDFPKYAAFRKFGVE